MEINEARYKDMIYNRCGKSGLKLPIISFGLWHSFGDNADYNNMIDMCKPRLTTGLLILTWQIITDRNTELPKKIWEKY